jgi:PucR C-terminal helix-turn-helix domain
MSAEGGDATVGRNHQQPAGCGDTVDAARHLPRGVDGRGQGSPPGAQRNSVYAPAPRADVRDAASRTGLLPVPSTRAAKFLSEPGRRLLASEDFDLGTLLVSEAPMERIDPKVEELLAPLRAHPLLLDAIEAYFEHEMDITRTAQALCLHPNTLRYRLGRLEQLLDLSLKQPSAIAALYIAMMAGDRSPR